MMNKLDIDEIIIRALKEDTGKGDITTGLLIAREQTSRAVILCKQEGVLCGLDIAKAVFQRLDSRLKFQSKFKDGDQIPAHTKVAFLTGCTRGILTAERVALNFLSYFSGIATKTRKFVKAVHPYKTTILDTRKTTPTLRTLEKFAVQRGGGTNHRFDLSEMIFIKDNHFAALQRATRLEVLVKKIRRRSLEPLCIEVTNLKEFEEALSTRPEIILLDNMDVSSMSRAVKKVRALKGKKPKLEASGGVTLSNVRKIAQTGVDRISIGSLTHSRDAIDFSLEIVS